MTTTFKTKLAAALAVAAVTMSFTPTAQADHHGGVIPSQDDVDRAKQQVATAQQSVAQIQADLSAANAQLNSLNIRAEMASEAYNGAMVAWQQARSAARVAQARADRAATQSTGARAALAGYFLSQDNTGSELASLNATLTADGAHTLLSQLSDTDASARALDARYQSWSAADDLAKVYQQAAEQALGDAVAAKAAAADAKKRAQEAVAAQQLAVSSIAAKRAELVSALAQAQHISIALAGERQQGLEQREEARQEERRRQHVLEQQRRDRHRQHHQPPGGGSTPPPPDPTPPPPIDPTPPPPNATAAEIAINFAENQLGEPYVWGADGPDSWDCSGLTMGAWAAAGVSLSHYSVSQYYETTHISYSKLKPGDLIFWSDDPNDPNTIFHVAMYIGDGQMIQAPHTGAYVEIVSVFYWRAPDFYGRV